MSLKKQEKEIKNLLPEIKGYLKNRTEEFRFNSALIYGLFLGLFTNYFITLLFQETFNKLNSATRNTIHTVVLFLFVFLILFIYREYKKSEVEISQTKRVIKILEHFKNSIKK